ncbi:MAG: AI-2E family transporter [Bryobacteraceae bacterium]
MLGIDSRAARATWTAILILALLALVYLIRETLMVFVSAVLFAFMLAPMVDLLVRLLPATKSRTAALAIVYVAFVAVLAVLAVTVGSMVAEQASALTARIPELLARMEEPDTLALPGVIAGAKDVFFGRIREQIQEHSGEIVSYLSKAGWRVVLAAGNLAYVVLVPILSFFLLKDGRAIMDSTLSGITDPVKRLKLEEILGDLNVLLAQYMRALIILALATFVFYGAFFTATGVPFGILLAAIACPLEFIPMVGPLVATAIILLVSGFSGYPHVLWIIVFLAAYRLFQDYVLQPHLMASGVELHPLLVILGAIAGGQIAGIPGTFLSVPVLAGLRVVYRRIRQAPPAVPVDSKQKAVPLLR